MTVLDAVTAFNQLKGLDTYHPLISVVHQKIAQPFPPAIFFSDLYSREKALTLPKDWFELNSYTKIRDNAVGTIFSFNNLSLRTPIYWDSRIKMGLFIFLGLIIFIQNYTNDSTFSPRFSS